MARKDAYPARMGVAGTKMRETGAPLASLRERKKQATRDALHHSAVSLVASRGLAAVTVEEIAAAANMSPRSFFNYFPTKEDAVNGWDPAVMTDMTERLRDRPTTESPPVALRAALLEVLAPVDADYRELLDRLRVTRSDPHLVAHLVSRWAETERSLATALAERRGTDPAHDHYSSLVVATTLSAARVAMMTWCDHEGKVPLAEELACTLRVLAAGLTEPKRTKR